MIGDVFAACCAVASGLLVLWSIAAQPRRAQCPQGWWMPEGARAGVVRCRPSPVGRDERTSAGFLRDYSVQPPGEIVLRLACRDTMQDGDAAWCR